MRNNKGVALYLVLSVLIVTVLVANLFLSLVLSQGRLTHHKVSRTQAYYAARLGMNYAIEMLSRNEWTTGDYTICKGTTCSKNEPDLPSSVRFVNVSVSAPDASGLRAVNVTVDYLYQE